jgi:hypothetical protein
MRLLESCREPGDAERLLREVLRRVEVLLGRSGGPTETDGTPAVA